VMYIFSRTMSWRNAEDDIILFLLGIKC